MSILLTPLGAKAEEAPVSQSDPSARDFGEVIITAPRMNEPMVIETDPRNPRQPVPPADGAGYLKNIPGFSVVRQGGIDGEPLLRGQGGSRLNVLLDGTPLLGGCPNRMDPPTAYIFPGSFDKLTVLKGPQSVVHGGTALGTVLVDRDTKRFSELGFRANATGLYGSFNRNDETLDLTSGAKTGYIRMMGNHSSSDDYRSGVGDLVHSNYWRASGTAMLGWTPDDTTRVEATLDHSQAQAAYAGGGMDGVRFDRDSVKLGVTKTQLTPLISKAQVIGYYNYVDHLMDGYTMRPYVGMGASNVDHLMVGGKARLELTPTDSTLVTTGIDYNQDKHSSRALTAAQYTAGQNINDKNRLADMTFDTVAAFGEVRQDITQASRVIGGYRLTHIEAVKHNAWPNLSDTRDLHSGFGRFEHDIDLGLPVTTFASLGHVQRAPDYWERSKSTASFSIQSERTNQVDVGALFKSADWSGSVSAFATRTSNYILVSSGWSKNIEAQTRGVEAELAYSFLTNWTAEATAAFVRGENLTDGRALAQTPPLNTTWAVKYDDGTFLGGLLLRAVSSQEQVQVGWGNVIGQDIGRTSGFAVLSANAGWRPHDAITVTGGIDNIFDKNYAEHVSKTGTLTGMSNLAAYQDTRRVNEPGRTLWMRGTVRF
ncbi:TonB-dependent copper receptor [Paramagnetospirillum kuznetsovii]|nr:TonB-dependent copper receptor [Paramagnetospirillum kuznetsovii]